MNTSCIRHPENNRYIQLHEWQVTFCEGNHCAALLLAFLSAWHNWKLKNDHYYHRANDIAEMHGDGRPHNQNAYLFFSMDELIEGCMDFYGKKAVNAALDFLVSLSVISIHKNPNKRYHFDQTKYFKFYPDICNQWIAETYPLKKQKPDYDDNDTQLIDYKERAKRPDAIGKNARPASEKARYITNTTNNNNQSIKSPSHFFEEPKKPEMQNEESNPKVQAVVDALTQQGFSEKHFAYPDTTETIQNLCDAGATVEIFLEAHAVATRVSSRGFGINYLAKVVEDLLDRKKLKFIPPVMAAPDYTERIPDFKEEYSGSANWMEDLIK